MWLNMRDNEIRAEGRKEGMAFQAVKMYRDLTSLSYAQIMEKIMKDFHLSREQAEKYLDPAFA